MIQTCMCYYVSSVRQSLILCLRSFFFRFFIRSCRRSSTSYFPLRSLPVFISVFRSFLLLFPFIPCFSMWLVSFLCVLYSLSLHSWHATFSSNLYFIPCLIAVVQPRSPVNLSNNSFYRQWYTLRSGSLLVLSLWNSKFFRMSHCMQSLLLCFYRFIAVSCVYF